MLNNQEKEATVSADISIGAVIVLTSLIGTLAHIYYFCHDHGSWGCKPPYLVGL